MKGFKASKEHSFYILTKKGSRVFHFHHIQDKTSEGCNTFLTICNLVERMSPDLEIEKISFTKANNDSIEKLILKNQQINIFWGSFINKVLDSKKHYKSFTIIANYMFLGAMEVMPIEIFNGI